MKQITALLLVIIFLLGFALPTQGQPDNSEVDITVEPLESTEPSESSENMDNILSNISAEAAILMDQHTGKILFSKNPDQHLYPASTTKVLTALLALEYGDLKDIITVGNEANLCQKDGSKAGLDLQEEISLENLIRGLMLPSGNDAAYTIAVYIARKIDNDSTISIQQALDKFNELMNERAKKLGAKNSHFVNPHGYHEDEHYTTAQDLAIITREAMKHNFFREVVKTQMFTIEDWNGMDKKDPTKKEIRYWRNSNALIQENDKFFYEYATGGKTGYTSRAGHCLVSTAAHNGMDLIAVVLNDSKEGKWTNSVALLDYGFNNYEIYRPVTKEQHIKTVGIYDHSENDPGWLNIIADKEYADIFSKKDVERIEQEILWSPELLVTSGDQNTENTDDGGSVYLKAPIAQGQKVGTLTLKLDGNILGQINLISSRQVDRKEKVIEKFLPSVAVRNPISLWGWIVGGIAGLIIILRITALRRRRRRQSAYRRRYRY